MDFLRSQISLAVFSLTYFLYDRTSNTDFVKRQVLQLDGFSALFLN